MVVNQEKLVCLAALNNAQWCHLVCQANRALGQFNDQAWHSIDEVPNYYPNIITLTPNCSLETVQAIAQQIQGRVSSKDSFNNLPLTQLGFKKLFDAQWLLAPVTVSRSLSYQLIRDTQQLEEWERAWSRAPKSGLFNQTILNNPAIRFVGIYNHHELVAGGIINKSKGGLV